MATRKHLFISGKVQGVTFRASTRRKARDLGVNGWVKNLPDGKVEAVFEGSEKNVRKIVDWCYSGPDPARVDEVEQKEEQSKGIEGFEIKY
ncbi:MAG: acylphosphatase [Candidatus Aenigmatarchaeota archaeon]